MASNDLIFQQSPVSQPAQLIFGEVESIPDYPVTLAAALPGLQVAISLGIPSPFTLAATLPGLQVAIAIATIEDVRLAATLPGMTVSMRALYTSGTERPVVAEPHNAWQLADKLGVTVTELSQRPVSLPTGVQTQWTKAVKRNVGATDYFGELRALQQVGTIKFAEAIPLHAGMSDGWRELSRVNRPTVANRFQNASSVAASILDAWQERFKDRRPTLVAPWGQSRHLGLVRVSGFDNGRPVIVIDSSQWQEAIEPPIGVGGPPTPPIPQPPCYTPPKGNEVLLVFKDAPGTTDLVFVCEAVTPPVTPTIVVPVKRVYLVNNTSSLHRVDTGQQLPAFSMQLSLDVDSWTWGFTASMPYTALPLLGRQSDGSPAELAAIINGVEYRVIFEKYSTTRQFGQMPSLSINCRGKQALLDAPYAPVTTFINDQDINANQLMLKALSINNVPLGWDVDFQLEDWIVPANQFALTGSYMGAVNQIAAAVGGYIQPSPVDQTLRALSRYPTAPWDWSTTHIDYELPSSVTTVEGIEYREKVVYNHVYVSGTSAGVTGSVKRAGTAGEVEKPMVTDPLIGDATAARQRGRVELSDVGRQEIINLTLPVLAETGIILPGAMVRYFDVEANTKRVGIVRSMGTAVSQSNLAETWQTLGVETHVN